MQRCHGCKLINEEEKNHDVNDDYEAMVGINYVHPGRNTVGGAYDYDGDADAMFTMMIGDLVLSCVVKAVLMKKGFDHQEEEDAGCRCEMMMPAGYVHSKRGNRAKPETNKNSTPHLPQVHVQKGPWHRRQC